MIRFASSMSIKAPLQAPLRPKIPKERLSHEGCVKLVFLYMLIRLLTTRDVAIDTDCHLVPYSLLSCFRKGLS